MARIKTQEQYQEVARVLEEAGFSVKNKTQRTKTYNAIREAGDSIIMPDGTEYTNVYASRVMACMHELSDSRVERTKSGVKPLDLSK